MTVTGKPAGSVKQVRDNLTRIPLLALAALMLALVVVVYAAVIVGALVEILGINNSSSASLRPLPMAVTASTRGRSSPSWGIRVRGNRPAHICSCGCGMWTVASSASAAMTSAISRRKTCAT